MSPSRNRGTGKSDMASKRRFAVLPLTKPTTRPEVDSIDEDDPVDQASYDSFPASDPPAYSSNCAAPGAKRDC